MCEQEPFFTLKDAAWRLQRPYHQIQRAARKGLFPTYKPFGRRPLVRLSEVVRAIEAAQVGGAE